MHTPRLLAIVTLTTCLLLTAIAPTYAAALIVSSSADGTIAALADNGSCDLREAVAAANTDAAVDACIAGVGADTITFADADAEDAPITVITLTAGQLVFLDSETTLDGGGDVTVRSPGSRTILLGSEGINDVQARTLTLRAIAIADGNGTGVSGGRPAVNGGCILVRPYSTLTVTDGSDVRDCTSTANGGGIYADESASVHIGGQSEVYDSRAVRGGGVFMITGTLRVDEDSCIHDNLASETGGGIHAGDNVDVFVGGGSVSNRGFLVNNTARSGGGVYVEQNSAFTGDNARFYGNTDSDGAEGGAWSAEGGALTRLCIACCIVGNGDNAVVQEINGFTSDWRGNWWGSDDGPYIADTTPNDASVGDSASDTVILPGSALSAAASVSM